ncbi:polyketide synthase [Nostoc sp. DedQUE09]|uniref:polyketide synthase n=1 Tax=Nostoc sp. DedQUE09 TaxID=3075394 RepID=UPI002AD4E911|nr:polyketide synthase [Nostoc sp. DedQUE09]MDZ7949839.1 beta-ketoacyl synthase N-terminal-like domain-containing protein [Nostoc sp. DedQUE09]
MNSYDSIQAIAIIGISGRFPGANDIKAFWENLSSGVESISTFTDVELIDAGIDPELLHNPSYVKSLAILKNIDLFDASFFGFNPREAEITDPQHRLFLECAWEALENAGYDSQRCESRVGVYAGASANNYLSLDLKSDACGRLRQRNGLASIFQRGIGNDKDFLATRVSYKLNLTGPSLTIQTACSTSLVATSLACQSLLNYQCDMALAGGVSINILQKTGYLYEEGGVLSPDGHCRAFDAKAKGTIIGNGVGIVVLKRLSEAIADGDHIYAVIKGSAINNDGSGKIGYTAPSVNGQADVVAEALALAGVEPETISYIEAHGSGTVLGDPIEISALTNVFRESTDKKGFCAIGSVKTNIGHLDAAAGVTSLIKATLALKHQQIPPSLNFEEPNPEIDFANSPFYVNTKLREWKTTHTPRRAGVSSLGIGGTNAHVILEEAPTLAESGPSRPWQLLVLSAKTDTALKSATVNLIDYLKQHPDLKLADVAYTLQCGRQAFEHRQTVVCQDIADAIAALEDPKRLLTSVQETEERPLAFMFPGLGTQYVNMAGELYHVEPTFRQQIDYCCEFLKPLLGQDLRDVIYPTRNSENDTQQKQNTVAAGLDLRKMLGRGAEQADVATEKLNQTYLTQPAIFVIEYALAQLWMSWGIRPAAMIGYSIGEYVAATLAGVLSIEDALTLVAKRAQMIQELPIGAMLAVPLSEEEVRPLLNENLSLSAINGSQQCVIAGVIDAVDELESKLTQRGLACRRLQTSHAFHSKMMDAIAQPFTDLVKTVSLQPPKIPYLSNVTGTWITAAEATNPTYWTRHLCETVRFADGVQQLWKKQNPILLEVGSGQTLSSLALQCLDNGSSTDRVVLPSLRHSYERQSDLAFLLKTLGQLWLSGVQIDWSGFYAAERRHRLPLPTYPFERQRYWIEPQKPSPSPRQFHPKPTASELWKSLVDAAQMQAIQGSLEFDDQAYRANEQWLDRLCTAYMSLALKHLGAFSDLAKKYSIEELFEQCSIIPKYRELLCRWLEVLVEEGQLQQEEGLFTNFLPSSTDEIDTLLEEVRVRWADTPQNINLIQLFGENLVAVLTGQKEPLELSVATLVQQGEISRQYLPSEVYFRGIMRAMVEKLAMTLPPDVNLRILEIGGGTGIATAELLPVFSSQPTNYTFTDVGGFFVKEAKNKFSAYPFVQYRLLDIERSPQKQGYNSHSFDVVVAVNVLHTIRNIKETLQYVHSLLAPGGFLLLWEITQPKREFDMIDGLLMNPIEDEKGSRNMGNPFLSKQQWQEALNSCGFVEVAALSEFEAFGEHVFIAQASWSAALSAPAAFTALVDQKDVDKMPQVLSDKKRDIADWFYIPSWKRSMPPQPLKLTQESCWLVFIDECGLGSQVVKRLKLENQNVITVKMGEQFHRENKSSIDGLDQHVYTINPRQRDDYYTLLKELCNLDLTPKTIVYLWSVTPPERTELGLESLDSQDLDFYSLLFLAQAIGEQNLADSLEIGIVSNNMQELTGEEVLSPDKALILGSCKTIPLEYPNINCRSIDVVIPELESWQGNKLVDQLLTELTTESSDQIIAYRGNHRWVQTFEPVRLHETVEGKPRLREGGVYLITGGLGGVGLVLAEYLAQTVKAKLVLTGRSAFPDRNEWLQWLSTHDESDSISCKIRKLQAIEALGAEVLVVSADVTKLEQMSAAIAQANNRFSQIHGVIHAALVLEGGLIQLKTKQAAASGLAPKVKGTRILDILFKNAKLDFFVLCSSSSVFKPVVGMVDYIAANAFIDTFAHYSVSKHGRFTRAINWDRWSDIGRAVGVDLLYKAKTGEEIAPGMTSEEGIEAFRRILFSSTVPQIVVSTQDLLTEVEQKFSLEVLEKANISKSVYQRPQLKNAYVAPTNESESRIADIYQELLGIEQVGIHDNFFELGGDSLIGTVLISQLRKNFQVELSVRSLFEAPSVSELAVVIEETIIEELEKLSEA